MRLLVGIVSALSIALSGCATKYQEMGLTGGVSAAPITDDTFRISARGNGYTNQATVQDYVLLKAAETTVQSGRTHFVIVTGNDTTYQTSMTTPSTMTVNHIGNTSYGTFTPGQTISFVKPGQDVIVRALPANASPQEKAGAMDARQIIANIGPRVKRPE